MTLSRSKPHIAFTLTLLIALAGCAASPEQIGTERYFTWVDEQGVLRHSPIHEPENELLRLAAQQNDHQPDKLPQAEAQKLETHTAAAGEGVEASSLASGKSLPAPRPDPAQSLISAASKQEDYSIDSYVDAAELQRKGFVRESDGAP